MTTCESGSRKKSPSNDGPFLFPELRKNRLKNQRGERLPSDFHQGFFDTKIKCVDNNLVKDGRRNKLINNHFLFALYSLRLIGAGLSMLSSEHEEMNRAKSNISIAFRTDILSVKIRISPGKTMIEPLFNSMKKAPFCAEAAPDRGGRLIRFQLQQQKKILSLP